jgi:hypothetical protein
MRDAIVSYYQATVDDMAQPGLIVKALTKIRDDIRVVASSLPSFARQDSLKTLKCDLDNFAERLSSHIIQFGNIKGKNRKNERLNFTILLLRLAFAKHAQNIHREDLQERWESYLDFALQLGEIPHPHRQDTKAPFRWKTLAGMFPRLGDNHAGSSAVGGGDVTIADIAARILDDLMPSAKVT